MSRETVVSELLDGYPNLRAARALSDTRVADARQSLSTCRSAHLDIVGFGSLARREMTPQSDFDYLVLARAMPEEPDQPLDLLARADDLRRRWATEDAHGHAPPVPPPGASGVFARSVGAFDLVQQIGLQEDTNHSLTRRMLLLEESVSLLNQEVHDEVLTSALRRYLELGNTAPQKVPRFLLNDVTRYWHTITVDYQAKARTGPDDSGLRYLKLIISRKVMFAGTVMTLLLCGQEGWHEATAPALRDQFALTPLERLVQCHSRAPQFVQEALEAVVAIVDQFVERSGDADWRATVKRSSKVDPCPAFKEMTQQADRLQSHLETVFFRWDVLQERSTRMLAF